MDKTERLELLNLLNYGQGLKPKTEVKGIQAPTSNLICDCDGDGGCGG